MCHPVNGFVTAPFPFISRRFWLRLDDLTTMGQSYTYTYISKPRVPSPLLLVR